MKRSVAFIVAVLSFVSPSLAQDRPQFTVPGDLPFDMKVLATGLQGPWEVTWGPDDYLWVTERTSGRIVQI